MNSWDQVYYPLQGGCPYHEVSDGTFLVILEGPLSEVLLLFFF